MATARRLKIGHLNLVLLAGLILVAMFQAGLGQTNCAAHAQTDVCQAADDVQISGDAYLAGALYVESTPTAGASGEVLVSQGSSSPPQWTDFVTEVLKAADETVSASTTLQDDDDFSFSAAANSTYLVEFGFRISENVSGSQEFKFNYTLPSGAIHCSSAAGASGLVDNECGSNDLTIDTGDTTESLSPAWSIIDIGGTAGTVQLQWAQDSASNNTTLHQYSTMRVFKIG